MRIEKIRLKNFRNHAETELEFSNTTNIFYGLNGQGKTNILEAITYVSLSKSFFSSSDTDITKHGEKFFEIESICKDEIDRKINTRIVFDKTNKKKNITINSSPIKKLYSMLGVVPTVSLFPEHHKITNGSPADRRKFIDIAITQSNPIYTEALLKYKKALQQRNALLSNKTREIKEEDLYPWTEQLVEHGEQIIKERFKFFTEFSDEISEAYRKVSGKTETAELKYKPSANNKDEFRQSLKKNFFIERRNKTTIAGPHRDDFEIFINGKIAKEFASQGQQKSFLVSLKYAEALFLKKRLRETPILILDDLFSELDNVRGQNVFNLFFETGQTIITSTQPLINFTEEHQSETKRYFVVNGKVKEEAVNA